ncbi:MAG: tRNA (adenosine(37)-N6)-threonylcarbamoyltransferase complex dimerization subunit type 1 TsaB [candidate division Zixibacteria bacterium]|nr:tRNA (adenosine(37)-N6)-threonylcarbamoyltransferase complex dimerization subunit type 1 TsaB [candidate division Zixibacteria bacterium]
MNHFDEKYQNVLAIDSSGQKLKLALSFGSDRSVQSTAEDERTHGQVIMKKIQELLESSGLDRTAINALAVSIGPGSFTGLRIGLAAAKGIAVALDIPIVAVSVFEIAAMKTRSITDRLWAIVKITRDEFIMAPMSKGKAEMLSIQVVKLPDLASSIGTELAIGIGFSLKDVLSDHQICPGFDELDNNASELLYLGREKLETEDFADIASIQPLYIQKSSAEIRYEQRQQRQ